MSVKTKSLFYYVDPVVLGSEFLDFSEGGPNIPAEIPVGARSPQDLLDAVSIALNEQGTQDYTVLFNRVTNQVTISALANFELNVVSGPNSANSVYAILGFTVDKSGANSYTSDTTYADEYRPQFWLQSYLDPTKWIEAVKSTVNESADGTIETFSFGRKSFYQMSINFITDIEQGTGGPVDNDPNAEANAQDFMSFITNKTNIEFMPDRDDQDTYDTVFLDSAPGNKDGTGFKLKQLNNRGLDGYYETGVLIFRKVD